MKDPYYFGRVPNNSCISLNSLGQIVGTSLLASEIKNSLAFLWTEKGCVAFQVTPEYEGSPSEGIAINTHGQIAGAGVDVWLTEPPPLDHPSKT